MSQKVAHKIILFVKYSTYKWSVLQETWWFTSVPLRVTYSGIYQGLCLLHTYFYIRYWFVFYNRDMFIEINMRPPRRLITDSNLDYIFNFEEEIQVSPYYCILLLLVAIAR